MSTRRRSHFGGGGTWFRDGVACLDGVAQVGGVTQNVLSLTAIAVDNACPGPRCVLLKCVKPCFRVRDF